MGGSKCVVCGYTFKGDEKKDASFRMICPYCGTIRQEFNGHDDFIRTNMITDGYEYLSKSMIKEASEKFNDYVAKYDDTNSEITLGLALLECRLSNCLNYNKDDLITVVHQKSLANVIENEKFLDVIKNNNPKIYNNVLDLYKIEKENDSKSNQVIILALNLAKMDELETLISNYSSVLKVDILDINAEAYIYPNISGAKALVVYVDNKDLLSNEYFLSIYYRFKALKKNIVIVYESKDIKILDMFSQDTCICYTDSKLNDKISKGIFKTKNEDNVDDGIIISQTEIKSICSKELVVPTNIVSIASRAAYQSDVLRVTVASTGNFSILERAFSESSIETFIVESKNCKLTIDKDAFRDCRALKTITFSNSDVTMKNSCFRNCISLRKIDLSMISNLEIPEHAFDGGALLDEVKLPKDIKRISKYAFRDTNIEEVELNLATIVDEKAFEGCKKLNKVIINPSPNLNLVITNSMFNLGCKIIFIGKESKKAFKMLKKSSSKIYQIELEK